MKNCFVRIDDRLVHGQILETWIPHYAAKALFVINDRIASDAFREAVMRMVVPKEIDVFVFSLSQALIENRRLPLISRKNTIFLFSNTSDVLVMFKAGFTFRHLNIGNICSPNATKIYSPAVILNTKDMENIEYLLRSQVSVEIKRTPVDRTIFITLRDNENNETGE